MANRTARWLLAATVTVAICLPASAVDEKGGAKRLLLATEWTEFKQALVKEIDALLKQRRVKGKLAPFRDLPKVSADDYDVIVVVSSVPQWGERGATLAFLRRLDKPTLKKVVLVTTANSDKWRAPARGLHAITSASKLDRVSKVVAQVRKALDAIDAPDE